MILVYLRHSSMEKEILSILKIGLDEIILVWELLYGKYDKATLVDNDMLDSFQFLAPKREVYRESVTK